MSSERAKWLHKENMHKLRAERQGKVYEPKPWVEKEKQMAENVQPTDTNAIRPPDIKVPEGLEPVIGSVQWEKKVLTEQKEKAAYQYNIAMALVQAMQAVSASEGTSLYDAIIAEVDNTIESVEAAFTEWLQEQRATVNELTQVKARIEELEQNNQMLDQGNETLQHEVKSLQKKMKKEVKPDPINEAIVWWFNQRIADDVPRCPTWRDEALRFAGMLGMELPRFLTEYAFVDVDAASKAMPQPEKLPWEDPSLSVVERMNKKYNRGGDSGQ